MSKNTLFNFIWRWGPALLVMVIFFIASSIPFKSLPNFNAWDTIVKKAGHLTGYFLLALALLHGLNCSGWKTTLLALGIVLLYAISDEFHQAFVAGRHSTLIDIGIDMIGATVGACLFQASARIRRCVLARSQ
jgi:VanZ family protein